MSTTYLARMPMGEFASRAKQLGWRNGKTKNTGAFALISPSGQYCHDIEQHIGGTTFVRSGRNADVEELAEIVGAVSEDDVGGYVALWDIAGARLSA